MPWLVADAAEPLRIPSHDAKITVKMTPETYSGVAVVAIEATDSVRSVRDPSRIPARMPIRSAIGHHRHHHPEHQDAGGAERRKQLAGNLGLELGRAAEVALQDARIGRQPRAPGSTGTAARPCPSPDRCSAASEARRATARNGRRSSGDSRCATSQLSSCSAVGAHLRLADRQLLQVRIEIDQEEDDQRQAQHRQHAWRRDGVKMNESTVRPLPAWLGCHASVNGDPSWERGACAPLRQRAGHASLSSHTR